MDNKENQIVIEFGNNDKASVVLSSFINKLELFQIKSGDLKIGDNVPSTIETEKIATMVFYEVKSIDTLIKHLNNIKENLIRTMAC